MTKSQPSKTSDLPRVDIGVGKTPGKRSVVRENGDGQPPIEDKVEEQTNKSWDAFLGAMDAIAGGVEARLEENTGHSRGVTKTTVDIARELGIPEAEIKRWAAYRLTRLIRDTEKLTEIKSLLERRRQNPA